MRNLLVTGLLTLSISATSAFAGQTVKQKIHQPKAPAATTQTDTPNVKKRIGNHVKHQRHARVVTPPAATTANNN